MNKEIENAAKDDFGKAKLSIAFLCEMEDMYLSKNRRLYQRTWEE